MTVQPSTDTNPDEKIFITNNHVYQNANKIVSYDPAKSFVTWHIDEGSGIFITNNKTSYTIGRMLVANNVVYKNGANGIVIHHTYRSRVVHNTVFKNGVTNTSNNAGIGWNTVDDLIVRNNLVHVNPEDWAIGVLALPVTNLIVESNIVWNENGSAAVNRQVSTGFTVQNPQYLDTANVDFRINASSPGSNAGVSGEWPTDIEGRTRSSTPDLGAYEIVEAVACTTNTWIGGTGNGSVAAKWSCGTVPDGSTDITITSGTPTLDLDLTIASGKTLTISGTGSLIIAAGKTLTIAGTADFGGKSVILRSTAAGDAAIGQVTGTLSNATQVTVERYIGTNKRAWRLLSIPVSGSRTLRDQWAGMAANAAAPTGESAGSGTLLTGHFLANGTAATAAGFDWYTGLTATSTSSIRFYSHNGTSGTFSSATNTPDVNATPAKQGYMLFVRGDRTVTNGSGTTTLKPMGTLASGTQNITITQAYEVVGNPYAATIDADLVYQNSGNNAVINRNFWIWDATLGTAGGYRAISYGGSAYTMTGGTGTATDYLKIRSGQAFYVQKNGSGGSITIQESNKTDGSTAPILLGGGAGTNEENTMNITLANGSGKMMDGVALRFGSGYKHAPDEVYDMPKMNNFNENLSLVNSGRYLSIDSRPLPSTADTAWLAAWNLPEGQHKWVINPSDLSATNLNALIKDAYTGRELPVVLNGQPLEHIFEINTDTASKSVNRFMIIFKPVAVNPTEVTVLSATTRPTGISVSWKVNQPSRLLYSELQGSNDGTSFQSLTTITAGMMHSDGSFTWLDRNPHAGINYYRVRTLTIDGNARFSQTDTAEWLAGSSVRILSNPSSDGRIRLILTNLPEGRYQVSVRKMNGALIHQQYLDLNGPIATPDIHMDRSTRVLSAGTYLITIDNGKSMTQTLKWIYNP